MVMIVSIRDLIDNNVPVGRKEMCFTLQPHLCISMFIEMETSVSSVVLESQGQIASPSMSFRLAFFCKLKKEETFEVKLTATDNTTSEK